MKVLKLNVYIASFMFSTHRWTVITRIRNFEAKRNPENQI